ncbi:calcium-transporting ATPase 10, plasma membrane-type-like isoform X2 [Rosa rugosa]|uniref:calcium-transporting ATPase 10, plasma membrane-type-like isoform X2 n=1 Tax=Rosa rugosa TaxID=74645 RepID=UPI002B417041|nr:calcium-transporting ATPase 10, plasma membrane-type-like isoform X2 [Rosa rugosa]
MTLVEAYVGLNKICLPDDLCKLPASISTGLSEAIALNTSGNVFKTQDGEVEISGSPTEKDILSWAVKLGMEFNAIRSKYEFLFVFPFNSEKKRSGVAVTYQLGLESCTY